MQVVVTGGAGFIGANLCRRLAQMPGIRRVVAFDDLSTGDANNLAGAAGIDLVVSSILDAAAIDAAVEEADAIVHLAARPSVARSMADPVASHECNAGGTVRVLEAARRAKGAGAHPHLIVASSSSVYGANPELPKHEGLLPAPISPYAATKLATESYALAWSRSFGLDVLVLRFFNVFGPLQPAGHAYAAVIPAFASAAIEGRPLIVHGDGRQSRDFTYVGSVTRVLADAVVRRVACDEPVNLAFGTRVSLLDVITRLEARLGRPLAVEHTGPRAGDVRHSQADGTRLRALFPSLVPVDFDDGLAATLRWFQTGALDPADA